MGHRFHRAMGRALRTGTAVLLTACAGAARPTTPETPGTPIAPEPAAEVSVSDAGIATQPAPDSAPAPAEGPDLQALRGRLRNALEPGQQPLLALPNRWPPRDRTLVFFIYTAEPLPTGRVTERIVGPVAAARVGALDLSVDLEDINAMPMRVEREPPQRVGEDLRHRAETLLLDVVAGRVPPGDARNALAADYCKLLDDGALGEDLRARAPEFVAWLQCDGFHDRGRLQIQTAP